MVSTACFAALALVARVVVSVMTLILEGGFGWLDLLTPPSTPDVGREVFQFGPRCNLDAIAPFVG
jgi:hypothetical protein